MREADGGFEGAEGPHAVGGATAAADRAELAVERNECLVGACNLGDGVLVYQLRGKNVKKGVCTSIFISTYQYLLAHINFY